MAAGCTQSCCQKPRTCMELAPDPCRFGSAISHEIVGLAQVSHMSREGGVCRSSGSLCRAISSRGLTHSRPHLKQDPWPRCPASLATSGALPTLGAHRSPWGFPTPLPLEAPPTARGSVTAGGAGVGGSATHPQKAVPHGSGTRTASAAPRRGPPPAPRRTRTATKLRSPRAGGPTDEALVVLDVAREPISTSPRCAMLSRHLVHCLPLHRGIVADPSNRRELVCLHLQSA